MSGDAWQRQAHWNTKYRRTLHSKRWRELRARLIVERGGCEACGYQPGGDVALTLHHLTYRRLGAERDEDVQVLCAPCHEARYREDNPHLLR